MGATFLQYIKQQCTKALKQFIMHCIIKYDFIALDLSFKKKRLGHRGKTPDAMSKFTPQTISKTTILFFCMQR